MENRCDGVPADVFAERVGINERDLKKIVLEQKAPFLGLKHVYSILETGLDLSVYTLVSNKKLTIIPSGVAGCAERMVDDQIAAEVAGQDMAKCVGLSNKEWNKILEQKIIQRKKVLGTFEIQRRVEELRMLRKTSLMISDEEKAETKNRTRSILKALRTSPLSELQ